MKPFLAPEVDLRKSRSWKWVKRVLVVIVLYVLVIEAGFRLVTHLIWRPLSNETAQEYIDSLHVSNEERRIIAQNRPCIGGIKELLIRITLAGGVDFLGGNTQLFISFENSSGMFRDSLIYVGPPTREPIIRKLKYCLSELNTTNPDDVKSVDYVSIIAIDMKKNSYINMESEHSYPVAAWKDFTIELYPWTESTLEEGFYQGHHIYPNDPDAFVPERFRRVGSSPKKLAPWR